MEHRVFVFNVRQNLWNKAWQPSVPKKKGAGRNPKEVTEKMKLLDPNSYIRKMERSLKKKTEEMAMGLQKMGEEGQRSEEIRKYMRKKGNEEQKILKEIERLKGLRGGAQAGPERSAGPVPVPGQIPGQWAYQEPGPAWPIVDPAPVPRPMPGQWAHLGAGPAWSMVSPAPVSGPMSMPGQIQDQRAYLRAWPAMAGPDFAGTTPVLGQMAQIIEPYGAQPNEHAAQFYDPGADLGWQQPQFAPALPDAAIWSTPGDIGNPILLAEEPILAADEHIAVADEPILAAEEPILAADELWVEPQPPAEDAPLAPEARYPGYELGLELDWMAMESS
ncbi:uncharacterized protein L3040_007372 [Drepanopeziza brunnea f. sp. 'multigermtubi']|uniref:uncharacterized protein n=1 Tax=Drepanopeziza brunnea f. sp. 'multigermtubi' TaxID=698441 RepID=UPI0023902CEF|nr:hypothetical protein L3040_007372 [Drepanopeziza brunnea f. sp. 'multigermtubi']